MKLRAAVLLLAAAALARGVELPAPLPAYWTTNTVFRDLPTNAAPAGALATPLVPTERGLATYAYRTPRAVALPVAPTSGVDVCFLPLGYHETGAAVTNVAQGAEILVCAPDVVKAVVWRARRQLVAGSGIPVLADHAGAPVGRVKQVWFDEARGGCARLELAPSGETAARTRGSISPRLLLLRASTTATTNGFPSDAYAIPWRVEEISLVSSPQLPGTRSVGGLIPLERLPAIPTVSRSEQEDEQ